MPTFREYHFHLPGYHVDNDRDLKLIFGSHLIFTVLSTLIFFFFPLFLFQFSQVFSYASFLSYTPLQQGMLVIAGYFLLMRVVVLVTAIPIARLLSTHGIRFSLLMGHVLYIAKLVMLTQAYNYPWLLLVVALVHGLFINCYWIAYQVLVTHKAHVSRMGKDLGLLQFGMDIMKMLAPALGGLIVVNFGYQTLFSFGVLLLMGSMTMVLALKTSKTLGTVTFNDVKKLAQDAHFSRYILTFGGRYINDAIITLWPLYVFLFLGAIDKVGYLYSVSLLIALLLSLLVGAYIDKAKTKVGFYLSGGTLSAIWLSRILAVTPWMIALTDTFDKLISPITWLFYDTLLFKAGKGKYTVLYFTTREIIISIWAILLWALVMIIFLLTQSAWQALFVIAALGVIVSLFMTDTFVYGKTKK